MRERISPRDAEERRCVRNERSVVFPRFDHVVVVRVVNEPECRERHFSGLNQPQRQRVVAHELLVVAFERASLAREPRNRGPDAPERCIEDVPVPAVPPGVAGSPQVARAGIIEERRRGGADVLSLVRDAPCSVAVGEPAFAELDLDEDQARTTVVVFHADRNVAGGELLVIRRLRPCALRQHVRRPLKLELDGDDADGKSESTGQPLLEY